MMAVPQVETAEFLHRNSTKQGLSYEELKGYILQNEANRMCASKGGTAMKVSLRGDRGTQQCYNCGDWGHLAKDCPHPVGKKFCYECKTVGDHVGNQCPKRNERKSRENNPQSGNRRYNNNKSNNNHRAGIKRKFVDPTKNNNMKRPRYYKKGKKQNKPKGGNQNTGGSKKSRTPKTDEATR